MSLSASLRDVPPVKVAREHYIGEEDVSGALRTPVQSLLGCCRLDDLKTGVFEGVHRYGSDQIIVVNDEHSHGGTPEDRRAVLPGGTYPSSRQAVITTSDADRLPHDGGEDIALP
jgi:hypothetical protein